MVIGRRNYCFNLHNCGSYEIISLAMYSSLGLYLYTFVILLSMLFHLIHYTPKSVKLHSSSSQMKYSNFKFKNVLVPNEGTRAGLLNSPPPPLPATRHRKFWRKQNIRVSATMTWVARGRAIFFFRKFVIQNIH